MFPRSYRLFVRRICITWQALLIMSVPALALTFYKSVSAADLANRSITLGTSVASNVTTHSYQFTVPTAGILGSIQFEYCTNTPFVGTACTAPAGLNVSTATIQSQIGITGFSVHGSSTTNNLIITRVAGAVVPQTVTYVFGTITNPSAVQQSVYVRISTYASTDASGVRTDEGAVVFSTARQIGAQAFVPPYLTFCVGVTVSGDCTSAIGDKVSLGELSSSSTKTGTSQMSAATNDVAGYVLYLSGTTLTSGNIIVDPIGTPAASIVGNSQFGINLRANTSPSVGQNPTGPGTGSPTASFNSPNLFSYTNGVIASSPNSTEFTIFTISYIANVPAGQEPGVYTTTATYIATANF
ncbi:MAG: hypothetical protein AAB459_03695 [Patescibacteria group bacterium]